MKKVIILLLLIQLIISFSFGEKLATLSEVSRADALAIVHGNIYVQEGITYHIYRLSDYNYINKFGKEGEGPQEFKNFSFMNMMFLVPYKKNNLFINSMGKVSIFSKEGQFISEHKKTSPFEIYTTFMDGFIAMGGYTRQDRTPVLALYLTDNNFNKKEPFHITDIEQGQNAGFIFPFTPTDFGTHEDKIYVVSGKEGFVINIYDKNGKLLSQIQKPYKPITLPSKYKENTRKWFKTSPTWKNIYDNFIKQRIKFKSHYPAIFQMSVNEGKMFILTNRFKDKLREGIVMSLEGKVLKRTFLPLEEMYGMDFIPKYVVYKDHLYILIDNDDEEVWELHRYKL